MSRRWRLALHQAEGRIRALIETAPTEDLLKWDRARGARWDDTEEDAQFIVTQCIPILEKHLAPEATQ